MVPKHSVIPSFSTPVVFPQEALPGTDCNLNLAEEHIDGGTFSLVGKRIWGLWYEKDNMTRYLITYDLNQPNQEYEDLYDAIKSYASYVHAMDSVWFIDTSDSVSDIRDNLKSYTSSNDELFISKISAWASNNVDPDATDWLHDHK